MADRVSCPVVFSTNTLRQGVSANAFRVMPHPSGDAILDFCDYEEAGDVATVVARVRVARSFLGLLDARLREAISEFATQSAGDPDSDGVLMFPDGLRFMMGHGPDETH